MKQKESLMIEHTTDRLWVRLATYSCATQW